MDRNTIIATASAAAAVVAIIVTCLMVTYCRCTRALTAAPFRVSASRVPRGSLRRMPSARSNSVLSITHPYAVSQPLALSSSSSSRSPRIAPAPNAASTAADSVEIVSSESTDSTASSTGTIAPTSVRKELQPRRSRAEIIRQASERGRELAAFAAASHASRQEATVVVQPPLLPPRTMRDASRRMEAALRDAAARGDAVDQCRGITGVSTPRGTPQSRMSPSGDWNEQAVVRVSSVVMPAIPGVDQLPEHASARAAEAVVEPSPDRPLNRVKFVPGSHRHTNATTAATATAGDTVRRSPTTVMSTGGSCRSTRGRNACGTSPPTGGSGLHHENSQDAMSSSNEIV